MTKKIVHPYNIIVQAGAGEKLSGVFGGRQRGRVIDTLITRNRMGEDETPISAFSDNQGDALDLHREGYLVRGERGYSLSHDTKQILITSSSKKR